VTEQVHEVRAPVQAEACVPVKEVVVDAVVLQRIPVGTVFARIVGKELPIV
jgi:hypothetical protein